MRSPRLVACLAVLGAPLGACGGLPDAPPPPLSVLAAELGTPPPGTAWVRETDLDGPTCVLRLSSAWDGGFLGIDGPVEGSDGTLSVRFVDPPSDSLRVDLAGTACATGLYGSREVDGSGWARIAEADDGAWVGVLTGDLTPTGGRFARAARSVRVLAAFRFAAEPEPVAAEPDDASSPEPTAP